MRWVMLLLFVGCSNPTQPVGDFTFHYQACEDGRLTVSFDGSTDLWMNRILEEGDRTEETITLDAGHPTAGGFAFWPANGDPVSQSGRFVVAPGKVQLACWKEPES